MRLPSIHVPRFFRPWAGRPPWRVEVDSARTALQNDVRRVKQDPASVKNPIEHEIVDNFLSTLDAAESVKYTSLLSRLRDWRSGAQLEAAWRSFHGGSQTLLMLQSPVVLRARLPEIAAALRASLQADDSRLATYQQRLKALESASDAQVNDARTELRNMLGTANSTTDEAHAAVRAWRNVLVIVGTGLVLAMLLLEIVHAFDPSFLSLTPDKPVGGETPEPWEIELIGAFGGALAAVVALIRIQVSAGAYKLPVYQAAFRLPVGAAAGLAAAVLLQGTLFNAINPQKAAALRAYALLFGFAQEALLGFLDRKANSLLGAARTRDDPQNPRQTLPPAH
jgi:hypothetical protein